MAGHPTKVGRKPEVHHAAKLLGRPGPTPDSISSQVLIANHPFFQPVERTGEVRRVIIDDAGSGSRLTMAGKEGPILTVGASI